MSNDDIDFQALGKMNITIETLMRLPIRQLKVIHHKLLKEKDVIYYTAIDMIRLIIEHKKGKIDLLE